MTGPQRRYVDQTAAAAVTGTPEQVADRLTELLDRTGAAELVASSSTFDRSALADSDAALAELFGRGPAGQPGGSAAASAAPSRP